MQRILLVDDHEMARKAMKHFLEHHGYACEETEHGAAALARLEEGPSIDLIVSDNHMPVMIGMDLLVQVKANPRFGSTPFILYSGNITDEMYQRAIEAGALAVLNKPYNFPDFVAMVNEALKTQ